jgi:DNA-directed RNA polymerase specialized sigma24 family protein
VDGVQRLAPAAAITVADPARALRDAAFTPFFRGSYRKVMLTVIAAGATVQEADEAAAVAMDAVLKRWGEIESPLAYACTAAVRSFIKTKVRSRRHEQFDPEVHDRGSIDPRLSAWEDEEWVQQLLEPLSPAQHAAMALVVDEYTPTEIAELLKAKPDAVRQRLHAARSRLKKVVDDARSTDNLTQPQGGM